jgi:uncharacterized protein
MRYNVAQLLKGPIGRRRQYDLHEEIGNLDPDLDPTAPLVGSILLTRTNQGVLVTGELQTTLRGTCRRCLEPCDLAVELELEELFYPVAPMGEAPRDSVPDEAEDEALWIDEHHILDLSEVIRQGLWLAEPEQALCRVDCAGLCPRCGGNRDLGECHCEEAPTDPRWAALQTLIVNEPDS